MKSFEDKMPRLVLAMDIALAGLATIVHRHSSRS